MFKQLHEIVTASNSTLVLTVAAAGEGLLKVNVFPRCAEGEANEGRLAPLCIEATPEELDAQFAGALTRYGSAKRGVEEAIATAEAVMQAAAKATKEAAATKVEKAAKATAPAAKKGAPKATSPASEAEDDFAEGVGAGAADAPPAATPATSNATGGATTATGDVTDNLFG